MITLKQKLPTSDSSKLQLYCLRLFYWYKNKGEQMTEHRMAMALRPHYEHKNIADRNAAMMIKICQDIAKSLDLVGLTFQIDSEPK